MFNFGPKVFAVFSPECQSSSTCVSSWLWGCAWSWCWGRCCRRSCCCCRPILLSRYLHWDFRNFWHSPVWNIQFDFFLSLNWEKIPVWNIKVGKSKIPVRVVKIVISKWTKMEFPRFPFLWFTVVGVVNPPDQKLVMYISVNCKMEINSYARSIKIFYPSPGTLKKIQFELVKYPVCFQTWKKNPVHQTGLFKLENIKNS